MGLEHDAGKYDSTLYRLGGMMPYKNDKDRFDQKARTSNFAGAVSMKDYGLFATAFDQDDRWGSQRFTPTNLTFCKSVLAIDGMLFSIGMVFLQG